MNSIVLHNELVCMNSDYRYIGISCWYFNVNALKLTLGTLTLSLLSAILSSTILLMFRGIKEFTLETEHQGECSLKVRTFSGSFVRVLLNTGTPFYFLV